MNMAVVDYWCHLAVSRWTQWPTFTDGKRGKTFARWHVCTFLLLWERQYLCLMNFPRNTVTNTHHLRLCCWPFLCAGLLWLTARDIIKRKLQPSMVIWLIMDGKIARVDIRCAAIKLTSFEFHSLVACKITLWLLYKMTKGLFSIC